MKTTIMTELDKVKSAMQHDITRLKQFDLFIKKLIVEGRITKDEISEFMKKKETIDLF